MNVLVLLNQQQQPIHILEKNKIEFVKEEKIETICDINIAKKVIKKLKEAHPYEEPAINIIPLINEEDL